MFQMSGTRSAESWNSLINYSFPLTISQSTVALETLWLAADRRVERPGHFLDEKFLPVQPPVIYLPKGPISRVDIIWTNGNARFFSWYLGAYDFLGHTSIPKGFATGNEVTTCWRFLDELKLGFLIRVKWFFCVLWSLFIVLRSLQWFSLMKDSTYI